MDEESVSVAVTGAAGYIGSRVVALLQQHHPEWDITALDDFSHGDIRTIGEVSVQSVDIRDRDRLEEALDDVDIVAHLAALSGVDVCTRQADLAYEVNVTGTNNVAWLCRKHGIGLTFASSMAVVGDPSSFPISPEVTRAPLNWYGRTKLLGERAIETFSEDTFPAHSLLKSNLYGEHTVDGERVSKDVVINLFLDSVRADEPLTVYKPGTQARNYVHVDDVARAYVRSVERLRAQLQDGATGLEVYTVGSDEEPSVRELATLISDLAQEEIGRDVDVQVVENPRDETLVNKFTVDTSAARNQLGWTPQRTIESVVRSSLRDIQ